MHPVSQGFFERIVILQNTWKHIMEREKPYQISHCDKAFQQIVILQDIWKHILERDLINI